MPKPNPQSYSSVIRNFTFGVEDSLVSTVGLLVGIAVGGVGQKTIVLTGLVLIFVEAFSMGVGSLLSEQSVEEYESKKEVALAGPAAAAVVMFVSYVVAGLIPLLPFMLNATNKSIFYSVVLTLAALFLLGFFNGRLFKLRAWRSGLTFLIMGGLAVLVGIVVSKVVGQY